MAYETLDEVRENRIAMEATIDAYGEIERAIGWYYYLEGRLVFPFNVRCKVKRASSPLKEGEVVQAMSMAHEDECEHEMYVTVVHNGEDLAVPLAQMESLSENPDTVEAVGDWHYWVARGYRF